MKDKRRKKNEEQIKNERKVKKNGANTFSTKVEQFD